MSRELEEKSTTNLLLDLVYHVAAERSGVPEIVATAQVDAILGILESRYGQNFGGKAESCFEWSLGGSSPLKENHKAKVVRMLELCEGKREFTATFQEMIAEMKRSEP